MQGMPIFVGVNINYDSCTREELIASHKALLIAYKEQEWKYENLTYKLKELERMIFGRKSERFVPETNPNQMEFEFEETATPKQQDKEETEEVKYTRKKPRKANARRQPLPDHLPREITVIEPEGDLENAERIGVEVTEYLEYTPGSIHVRRIERPKYKITPKGSKTSKIIIADLPERPIPKGILGPTLIAKVFTDKYVDHLPLYRITGRFKRNKIPLARSTLNDAARHSAHLLVPMYEKLEQKILSVSYLGVDESSIPVMAKDHPGSTVKGCMLVQYAPLDHMVLFSYTKTKEKLSLARQLASFRGHLQADGNVSYEGIAKKNGINSATAWYMHAESLKQRWTTIISVPHMYSSRSRISTRSSEISKRKA